jgi:hypothetical protein
MIDEMRTWSDPKPCSDKELTLRAIATTFRRAASAQRHPEVSSAAVGYEAGPDDTTTGTVSVNPHGRISPTASGFDHDLRSTSADAERASDGEPAAPGWALSHTGPPDRDPGIDPAIDLATPEAELPNPLVTDGLLRHFMEQATLYQGGGRAGLRGLPERLISSPRWRRLSRFNSAIVHALHQLDHRTRLHERSLAELEAETAAIRRALTTLESRFHQQL